MNSYDPWSLILTDPSGEVIYPEPSWGHPFYQEVPSWIHGGDGDVDTRTLFEGAFIGTEAPPSFSARAKLDDHQTLHVEVCVDGRCYKTTIDLAPAIAAVMVELHHLQANLQANLQAMMANAPAISGDVVVGAVDRAVGAAADGAIGALVERHYSVAGWWHGLTHGIAHGLSDVGHGIKKVADKAGDTVKALKGPISMVAAAAATAVVGPEAAPLVSKITGALADVAGGDYKGAGQAVLGVAQKAAAQNPQVAQVLDTTKAAFAQSTAAHHVALTAHQASAGDPNAQQKVAQIATAAKQGDSTAQQLIGAAQNVAGGQFDLSSLTSALGGALGGSAPATSGWW